MFKIGQEIIAIRNHSRGKFKKGDTFIIKSIEKSPCTCHEFLIDIGITTKMPNLPSCASCNNQFHFPDNRYWFSNYHFAPVIKNFADLVIESLEIVEAETEELIIEAV